MKRKPGAIILLLVFCAAGAMAQRKHVAKPKPMPQHTNPVATVPRNDTTIKSTTLEVYQQYEPELKPMVKPELAATLPPPATRAAQQYEVPQQTLNYSYRALPLRPLALGQDSSAPPPANYGLLGGGNLSTILTEIGIGSLRGSNWQSGLLVRYLTQEGDLSGQVFRSFQVKGNASMSRSGYLWDAGIDVQRNVVGAYGYNHDMVKHSFDDIRREATGATIHVGVGNEKPGVWGLSYHPTIYATYFTATAIDHETTFRIEAPFSKQVDSNVTASIGVNAWITNTGLLQESRNNSILQFAPAVKYTRGLFAGVLGLYPTIGTSRTELLPDIHASLKIRGSAVMVSAGWQASLTQNTAQQLLTTNPFLERSLSVFGMKAQTRTDDVFARMNIGIGKHMSVWARGGWEQFSDLPLFVTQYLSDGKDFGLIYDPKVNAIVWGGGIDYAIGEDFVLSGSGTWYNYYKSTYDYVWGQPAVRLKGSASWKILRGLHVAAYLEVLDDIWGLDALNVSQKLKGVIEPGASAEYNILPRLNLFLRAENLLGRKNERWLGYPSFGFNIYGGLRFLF